MTDTFRLAVNTVKPNNIEFRLQRDNAPQEIIRLDSKGFHYRNQLIEDAGEAHQLMVEFLKQSTQFQPEPAAPTVMEIIELHSWLDDEWQANNDGEDLPALDFARAVLAKWGRQ